MRISDWSSACALPIFHAQTEMFNDAAASRAQRTEAMCIVDHHPGATLLRRGTNRRQFCEIAVHAEYAIGHHQSIAGLSPEIGRQSCRERVCQYVSISGVARVLKKNKSENNK